MEESAARELMDLIGAEFNMNRQLIHAKFESAQQLVSTQFQAAQRSLSSSQDRALELVATRLNVEPPKENRGDKLFYPEVHADAKEVTAPTEILSMRGSVDIKKYKSIIEQEVDAEIRRRFPNTGSGYSVMLDEIDKLVELTARNEEKVRALQVRRPQSKSCAGTDTDDLQQQELPDQQQQQQTMSTPRRPNEDDLAVDPGQEKTGAGPGKIESQEKTGVCAAMQQPMQDSPRRAPSHSPRRSPRLKRVGSSSGLNVSSCSQGADVTASNDMNDLRLRNRELLSTIEQFKQDNEVLAIENKNLRGSAATFETEKEKVASDRAKIMGHSNPKQKIQYTMNLHEQNNRLREDYQKLRKQYLKLEASKKGNIIEELPSLFALSLAGSSKHRSSSAASVDAGKAWGLSTVQETVLEGVVQDCLHLRALIERAVSDAEPDDGPQDISTLLERLRQIAIEVRNRQGVKASPRSDENAARPLSTLTNTVSFNKLQPLSTSPIKENNAPMARHHNVQEIGSK